jgi:hypothetical protein
VKRDDPKPVVRDERVPICIECRTQSDSRAVGWRAYLGDDDEVVVFCPGCASREFDDWN